MTKFLSKFELNSEGEKKGPSGPGVRYLSARTVLLKDSRSISCRLVRRLETEPTPESGARF